MSFYLECKKIKRTGFLPGLIGGGILAAIVPVTNMAFRSEIYLDITAPPMEVLLNANWQMMAMLNVLIVMAGACLMYHTEYGDNAIQRMCTLPIRESEIFFGKFMLMAAICFLILFIEAAAIAFCVVRWFTQPTSLIMEIFKNFGYSFLLLMPTALLSLLIAAACKNMWISLGIEVICVFTATLLPTHDSMLSLFPFSLPFQIFTGTAESTIRNFIIADIIEMLAIALASTIFLKVRRSLE